MSVSDDAYLAMPRGGMDPYHLLIVPIACICSRQLLSPSAKCNYSDERSHLYYVGTIADMNRYDEAVDDLFKKLKCTSIKFER